MSAFRNWNIRLKVLSVAALLGLFLVLSSAVGLYVTNQLTEELNSLHAKEMQQASLVNAIRTYTRGIEVSSTTYLLAPLNQEQQTDLLKKAEKYSQTRTELISRLEKVDLSPEDRNLLAQAREANQKALTARKNAFELRNAGQNAAAWSTYFSQAQPNLDKANELLLTLNEHAEQSALIAKERAEAMTSSSRWLLLGFSLAALFCGACFSFWLAGHISASLQAVTRRAGDVAAGDLSGKDLAIEGQDEIGQLTNSFNGMQGKLRHLVSTSITSADQVASAAEELTANEAQCAEAAQQITASLAIVAEAAKGQQQHVEKTSAAIQEISASTQEVSATVENLAQEAAAAAKTAEDGGAAVREAVHKIQDAAQNSEAVKQTMTHLEEGSKKIAEIVGVITAIADQTNLLALNAAIEAARAGEAGRGFAVVAEEVRKLAEDSAKAAGNIGELIAENERSMVQALATTNSAGSVLLDGANSVDAAGRQFSQIVASIENLATEMQEISRAVDETAKGSQSIVDSAAQIDTATQHINSEIQQVTAAMEEQTSSMDEVASAGRELAQLAEQLSARVHEFKV